MVGRRWYGEVAASAANDARDAPSTPVPQNPALLSNRPVLTSKQNWYSESISLLRW